MQSAPVARIVAVILCGGSGTRLWPLSRQEFPKQFVPIFGGRSLLDLTLARVTSLPLVERVVCITGEAHRFLVKEAMERAGLPADILLEPRGMNTGPAIVAATLAAAGAQDPLLLFLPSDHHIPDAAAFASSLMPAVAGAREGWWLTMGVKPAHPTSAYGYVEPGGPVAAAGSVRAVARFIEKPAPDLADDLVGKGCLWNAGIFLVQAGAAVRSFERWLPDTLAHCRKAVAGARRDGAFLRLEAESFGACEPVSIDYGLLEKHDRVAVVPFEGGWSDVGSWSAFSALGSPDAAGNAPMGDARLVDSQNTLLYSPDRLAVAMGVSDLVIVDTADALLIASKEKSESVRHVVAALAQEGRPEVHTHKRVARPWGSFERIGDGQRYQVKRITVRPGASLSLQYHLHRAEHWIVVKGTARVTRGDDSFFLYENESTFIAAGMRHRLENPGHVPLEIIEVQTGSYLGEDDIVRLEDAYDRELQPARKTEPTRT